MASTSFKVEVSLLVVVVVVVVVAAARVKLGWDDGDNDRDDDDGNEEARPLVGVVPRVAAGPGARASATTWLMLPACRRA